MHEIEPSTNPFDKIRREDHLGEYWTGRELQPLMDYSQYRDFATVIEKAKAALALVEGQAAADQAFQQFTKVVQVRKLGDQQKHDYRLTRFGAYLVALAGDDTKKAVARARVYFTLNTRRAEVMIPQQRQPEPPAVPDMDSHEGQLLILDMARKAVLRAIESDKRAEKAEGFKRAIEAGNGLGPREFHKKYFSTTPDGVFFEHLYRHKYLIDQRGKGGRDPETDRLRDGPQHRHPSAKGKPFFYRHGTVDKWGKRRENTYVRPGEPELALRDALAAEGLVPNEVPALFELEVIA